MKKPDLPKIELVNLEVGYFSPGTHLRSVVYGPVNLSLPLPELVAVIGKNGIGKSTLLRTLAGLQEPLHGHVFFNGLDSKKISRTEMARQVSYVSTELIHVQHLCARDLVSLGRFPYSHWFGKLRAEDHSIINLSMEYTGISHLAMKPVYNLSDGERQKVMIARALAQDTPVIILDEPTAYLDLQARHEILRLLNTLTRDQGKMIVFSTHDLSIAMDETDKLWIMTPEGISEGAPEDLLINHEFRKLFEDPLLDFDYRSMTFRYNRMAGKSVFIKGKGQLHTFTGKAMERIGFAVSENENADYCIRVEQDEEGIRWHVEREGPAMEFKSLYTLCSFLTTNA